MAACWALENPCPQRWGFHVLRTDYSQDAEQWTNTTAKFEHRAQALLEHDAQNGRDPDNVRAGATLLWSDNKTMLDGATFEQCRMYVDNNVM